MKYYTGIGSRETPVALKPLFGYISRFLMEENYILRSGGADGADLFFEEAVPKEKKEIYVPWYLFNHSTSPLCNVSEEVINFSLQHHPNPGALSDTARKIMGRNAYQVLGLDLRTPSDFVLCYTMDGTDKGGTSQAIRIARAHGIKVFNLFGQTIEDFKNWYTDNSFDLI